MRGNRKNQNINVSGNTKTVIMLSLETCIHTQEICFRDAIIRTQRQLAQNGYFDPEKLGVNPMPNPNDGTVTLNM